MENDKTFDFSTATPEEKLFLAKCLSSLRTAKDVARHNFDGHAFEAIETYIASDGRKILADMFHSTLTDIVLESESEQDRNCPNCKNRMRNRGTKKKSCNLGRHH